MTPAKSHNLVHGETYRSAKRPSEEEVLALLEEFRITQEGRVQERIVSMHTNLVESVARRFSGAAEPFEDLAQEGYIGLINAIDLYDVSKRVKFSTYATHFIIGQIKHYLRDRGKIIKEPAWLQELNQRMSRAIESLTQQLGHAPSNLQIAKVMKMTEEAVAEMMMTREIFKVSSIDGSMDSDDDNSGTIDIERSEIGISFQLPVEDRIVLDTALSNLKDLEQRVIQEFYFQDRTQTEIAKDLGISCNYVSHILRNSTKKLKKILQNDELRDNRRRIDHLQKRLESQQNFMEQHAVVDPLTRLYNRNYFHNRLEEEISRASRHQHELAILFVYLSGLEAFGRSHGTLRGDEAILKCSAAIQNMVRRVDIVTRYSKDSFALILPHTGQNIHIVRTRMVIVISDILEEHGWLTGKSPLSLQCGGAHYPFEAGQADDLVRAALSNLELLNIAPEATQKAA